MGCTQSSSIQQPIAPGQNPFIHKNNINNNKMSYFNQSTTIQRPKFLDPTPLHPQIQSQLWSSMQNNSLKQFGYLIESNNIPVNIQVSSSGQFYNLAHFCCRWNAVDCLYYIIKKTYKQKSSLLLSLMNQRTIQGYTVIMMSIVWGSQKCFNLVVNCGAIDLSYTDKANNDAFTLCNLYKRYQMLEILNLFKKQNKLMIVTQVEQVRGWKSINQMIAINQFPNVEVKLTKQRLVQIMNPGLKEQKRLEEYEEQQRLKRQQQQQKRSQRQQLQQKYSQNMQRLSNQQQQQTYSQQQSSLHINKLKQQQQRKYQQQLKKIKQKQDEYKRQQTKRRQKQQMQRLKRLQQQSRQINKQRQFEESQLKKIQQQKQIIRRNIQAMQSNNMNSNQYVPGKGNLICPSDIVDKYNAVRSKGQKFIDSEFPPQLSSIGDPNKFKFGWDNCKWLRPSQIFNTNDYKLFDGISPEDIKQGTLGVCYYLAVISSIAEYQERIKKLFRFYDTQLGFYAIQLYMQGNPITVIVDDLIPCLSGTNQPLFSKPNSKQTWVMILQKAWVKLFGTYLSAQKMAINDMINNVLPAPYRSYIFDVNQLDKYFQQTYEYEQKKYVICASSINRDDLPSGVVPEHAYSILGVYKYRGMKFFKIRNPWGKMEYNGEFGDNSLWWQDEGLKKLVQYKPGDDGIFYFSLAELTNIVPSFDVSMYKDGYEYSSQKFTSASNQQVFFTVNINNPGLINFKICQKNQRFTKLEYQNCPIIFEISKITQNYEGKILFQGQPSCAYNMCQYLNISKNAYEFYEAGRYMIRVKMLYDRAHHVSTRGTYRKLINCTDGINPIKILTGTSTLGIYGPQKYVIQRLPNEQGIKYMKNIYKQYITRPGIQFSICHRSTTFIDGKGIDTCIAKSVKMVNQVIYFVENFMEKNKANFMFKFQKDKLRNTFIGYNVDKNNLQAKFLLDENGGWDLCTLQVVYMFQDIATQGELGVEFKIVR